MKPYIEYKDNKYEFSANFTLKKSYEEKLQKINSKRDIVDVLDDEFLSDFVNEVQNGKKEFTENDFKNLILQNPRVALKLASSDEDIQNNLNELNEEYCFKMLELNYKITRKFFEEIESEIVEDRGMKGLYELFGKICRIVFTNVANEGKPTKTYDWEN